MPRPLYARRKGPPGSYRVGIRVLVDSPAGVTVTKSVTLCRMTSSSLRQGAYRFLPSPSVVCRSCTSTWYRSCTLWPAAHGSYATTTNCTMSDHCAPRSINLTLLYCHALQCSLHANRVAEYPNQPITMNWKCTCVNWPREWSGRSILATSDKRSSAVLSREKRISIPISFHLFISVDTKLITFILQ